MNPSPRSVPLRALFAALAGVCLSLHAAHAQPVSPAGSAESDSVVELSPFEISTDQDSGYVATNTLAGSRLNTSLLDTPASISVMTKEFLDDIAAISVTQALDYAVSSGFDIHTGDSSSRGGDTGNRLFERDYNFQVRGYRQATQTRDYFVTLLDGDTYNIERIDVARGPNSLLFGVGGPSGVINTSPKRAVPTRDFGQFTARTGSYGMQRATLDYNEGLLDGKLGIRANLLHQRADGYHDFESDNQKRGALALTWRATDSTTVRVSGELGRLHQNRVRPWALTDNYSHWADIGRPTFAFGTAQAPAGYLATGTGGANLGTTLPPLVAADQSYSQAQSVINLGGVDNGLPLINPDQTGRSGEFRTAQTGIYNWYTDGPLAGKVVFLGGDPSIGGGVGTNRGARYYRTSNGYGNQGGFDSAFPVTDESVYPRTGNAAGPGQFVEVDYHVLSATIEHRLGKNLHLEATANRTYREGLNRSVLGFTSSVTYDAAAYLPTFRDDYTFAASLGSPTTTGQGRGQLNFGPTYTNLLTGEVEANPAGGGLIPNPYAGQFLIGYNPSYSETKDTLDDFRVSASYQLDGGRWWGKHNLLAFVTRSESKNDRQNFSTGNLDPRRSAQNVSTNVPQRWRHVDPFSANLADRGIPDPWNEQPVSSVIYGVSSVVDGQPYTMEHFTPGFYRSGWSGSLRQIDSGAVAAQSRFNLFGGDLVTTIGGRRDHIRVWNNFLNTNAANGPLDRDPATQIVNSITRGTNTSVDEYGNTYSVGAVYHLPFERLKWLSVFANKSTNFQDQGNALRFEDEAVRQTLEIGPLKGIGRDFGAKARLFDGRINTTLTYFEVDQDNVSSGVGSGNVATYINAIWTTIQNGGPNTAQTDAENPSGHHVGGNDTRAQTATGWEFEVTANLTRQWNLSFNYSDTDNVQSKLGNNLAAYLDKHRATWMQSASLNYDTGRAPGFLNNEGGSNTIGALVYDLDNVFLTFLKSTEGLPAVGTRAKSLNVFSTYRFENGPLKNLTIGGGVNYKGPQIIGIRAPTLTDPTYEIFEGHIYYLVNGMLKYDIKLRNETRLSLQLNVNNLFDFDDLLVLGSNYNATTQSIGKWYYHIQPRTWTLSASYSF